MAALIEKKCGDLTHGILLVGQMGPVGAKSTAVPRIRRCPSARVAWKSAVPGPCTGFLHPDQLERVGVALVAEVTPEHEHHRAAHEQAEHDDDREDRELGFDHG